MNAYKLELIKEHKALVKNLSNLNLDSSINTLEYANRCIQFNGMEMYERALRSRLNNVGICIDNGEYFEHLNDKVICEAEHAFEVCKESIKFAEKCVQNDNIRVNKDLDTTKPDGK